MTYTVMHGNTESKLIFTEYTYTNPDSIAYYTPRLYGIACYS